MSFITITSENVDSVLLANPEAIVLGVFSGVPSIEFLDIIPEFSTYVFAVANVDEVTLPNTFDVSTFPVFFLVQSGVPTLFSDVSSLKSSL